MTRPDDLPSLVGGGGIFAGMVVVFRMLVRRLTAQDTGWKAIVDQQKADIIELRTELANVRTELATARIQIRELQQWDGPRER